MDDNAISDILGRLSRIEDKLDRLNGPVMTVPPIMQTPTPRPVQSRAVAWEESVTATRQRPSKPTATQEETEYFLGAKILPRVGAGVLAIMFAYFVSIAYDRGWIGPSTIFGAAILLCAILIGVGQRMREEKEDYGQILTGLGSCGMFVTFAGGQIYQHLYRGEMLIGLFVLWSFANLAYGTWRKSRAFVSLGLAGGLLAAAMPLDQSNLTMSVALYALIFVPTVFMVAWHRWRDMALVTWAMGVILCLTIGAQARVDFTLAMHLLLEATSLIGIGLVAWCGRSAKSLVSPALGSVGTFLIGLFLLWNNRADATGAAHVLVFGLASAAVAYSLSRKEERLPLLSGGLLAAAMISPFGLEIVPTTYTLIVLSGVAAAASFKFERRAMLTFAGVELMLALLTYLALSVDTPPSQAADLGILCLATLVTLFAGISAKRLTDSAELGFFIFTCIAGARFGFVAVETILEPRFATTAMILCGSTIALALGFIRGHRELRMASLAGLTIATVKVLTFDLSEAGPFARVGLLFIVGLVLLAGGYWYIWRGRTKPVDSSVTS